LLESAVGIVGKISSLIWFFAGGNSFPFPLFLGRGCLFYVTPVVGGPLYQRTIGSVRMTGGLGPWPLYLWALVGQYGFF